MDSFSYKVGLTNDLQFNFKNERTLENRRELVAQQRRTHPDEVFVVVEPHKSFIKSDGQNAILKERLYYIKGSDQVTKIREVVQQNLPQPAFKQQQFFIFCNNNILSGGFTVQQLYDRQKDPEDEILYIKYARHDTFGHQE